MRLAASLALSLALRALAAPASPAPASPAPASPAPARRDNVFPTPDGFPNPSTDQLQDIQGHAFGTLPNGPPPKSISPEGLTNLKLIALNEMFEVAYFTELLANLTARVPGYDLGYGHEYVTDAISAVVAQEKLHALNANLALQAFGQAPIAACQYTCPVADFQSAIATASLFGDLVLGTLQDVNQLFAANGDASLVRGVSSVIGQEGEQNGFYRLLLQTPLQSQKKNPSALPFLTTSTRDFAFSALLQNFILPGSCPNLNTIPLKHFAPLKLVTPMPIAPADQTLTFCFDPAAANGTAPDDLRLVFINQQNVPVVTPLGATRHTGAGLEFDVPFPYFENEMNGLTIAAVTRAGNFANADDAAAATLFGPALIEIN